MNKNQATGRLAVLVGLLLAFPAGEALAQRGGRGGGGGMRGGGGGMRGGGGGPRGGGMPAGGVRGGGGMPRPSAPSMPARSPSFSPPRRPAGPSAGLSRPNVPNRPSPGAGASRPSRPNRPPGGGGNISQLPSGRPGGGRPGGDLSRPGGNHRPPVGDFPGLANRPDLGPGRPGGPGRPDLPQRPGIGDRPGIGNRPEIGGRPGIGNRPEIGGRPDLGNRPGIDNRPGIGDRPGIGGRPDIGNRPGIDNRPGIGNRPGIDNRPGRPAVGDGSNIASRPIVGNRPVVGNGNRNVNINNINNRPTNIANNRPTQLPAGRPDWWGSNGQGWWRAGAAYHRGWVNGYWNGFDDGRWNSWGNWVGATAIAGLTTWGVGAALNNWGYMPYSNPYAYSYVSQPVAVEQPVAVPVASYDYSYSQPIDSLALPPAEDVTQASVSTFDRARSAFLGGDYPGALALTEQALAKLPSDATIHEFRALCLFALGRYDESAATLYAVLSAGPGWDWTTLSGLYPSVDIYTGQLRALEAEVRRSPKKASPRFVLAYHYLTAGNNNAALAQYREVLKLQPNDSLSAQLAQRLGAPPTENVAAAPPADPAPAVPPGRLEGRWAAEPMKGVSISLVLDPDRTFTWTVTDRGKPRVLKGQYEAGDGELLLSPTQGEALDGRLTWRSPHQFVFQLLGGGTNDPGLTFQR